MKEALVTDVTRSDIYHIQVQKREGSNEFHVNTLTSSRVVLACPPSSFQDWSIAKWIKPLLASVRPVSLHHIYGCLSEQKRPSLNTVYNFHITTNSALCQTISSPYPDTLDYNDARLWFQVSYSSGRIADFWERLKVAHPQKFKQKLRKEVAYILGPSQARNLYHIKNYYWKEAVHEWIPSFGMDMSRMYRLAMIPDPIHLPGLYIVGEAFSPLQGWCEGALETVENLLNEITQLPSVPIMMREYHHPYVLYRSRVLDLSLWIKRHPGGSQAILNHLGEDITNLWDSIHNTMQSKAMIAALQVGWQLQSPHNNSFNVMMI
jgi:hypothetical protein